MDKRYGNTLTIILVIAIVLIIGILGFFAYRMYTSSITDKNAHDKVLEFDQNTENNANSNKKEDTGNTEPEKPENSGSLDDIVNNMGNDENSIYDNSNSGTTDNSTYITVAGNRKIKVIGTISIPKINIEYPILEECTSEALKVAIAAYYPEPTAEAVNKVGNLVLWGHNYKNGKFFSNLGELSTGDKVYIKDMSGTKLQYQVYNVYETTDSDVTYARRDTEGRKEISLSTCSNQSGKRTIVWASEVK